MTGLETAIILIAFVTVSAVLAYSVLTSGLFSTEKAKETVYKGLEKARGTLELKSAVIGTSANMTELESVIFFIALAVPNQQVDINAIVINYWDSETHAEGVNKTITLSANCTERGTVNNIEQDEQFRVAVDIPEAANVGANDTFSIQVLPSSGGAITITRTLPYALTQVMDFQ